MNTRLLRFLMLAYGAFGAGFALWIVLALGGVVGLPLPLPVLVAATVANLLLAVGIARRHPATRWLAVAVHAVPTGAAIALALLHLLAARPVGGRWPLLELAGKAMVHAALLTFWLRSATARGWHEARIRDGPSSVA